MNIENVFDYVSPSKLSELSADLISAAREASSQDVDNYVDLAKQFADKACSGFSTAAFIGCYLDELRKLDGGFQDEINDRFLAAVVKDNPLA